MQYYIVWHFSIPQMGMFNKCYKYVLFSKARDMKIEFSCATNKVKVELPQILKTALEQQVMTITLNINLFFGV